MAVSGIELTPDACVVVAARVARDGVSRIVAARRVELVAGEASTERLTQELAEARRALRLPRRAAVVDWTRGRLREAVTRAGFEIETVQSPGEAAATLAARTDRPSVSAATAWIVLHDTRAAIAVVSSGDVLISRVLTWPSPLLPRPSATTHLLRRYLLVAHVAPYLENAVDIVRRRYGFRVSRFVVCGDASELTAVSVALSQEIRRPVETLDSAAGLDLAGRHMDVSVAALHLAAAAATTAPSAVQPRRLLPRVAAAAVLLLALAGALAALGVRSQSSMDELKSAVSASQPAQNRRSQPAETPPIENRDLTPRARTPASGSAMERDVGPNRR